MKVRLSWWPLVRSSARTTGASAWSLATSGIPRLGAKGNTFPPITDGYFIEAHPRSSRGGGACWGHNDGQALGSSARTLSDEAVVVKLPGAALAHANLWVCIAHAVFVR